MDNITSIVFDELGSLDAEPGCREWAIAVRLEIQGLLKDQESNARHLQAWVRLMEQHAGYRQLTDRRGQTFKTYESFCKECPPFGLGYESDVIDRIIKERESAQTIAAKLDGKTVNAGPGPLTQEEKANGHIVPIKSDGAHGNAADYLARRIKRDAPEVFSRLEQGEYRSVRAAAIDAGIVRVPTALQELQRIWRKASVEERRAFHDWLHENMESTEPEPE